MARTPMITRTIQTTKAKVLCLNIVENKPFEQDVVLPRVYKDDAHILKQAKKIIENESVKCVYINTVEVVETLYGMTEQKFIENADILPPRSTKTESAE